MNLDIEEIPFSRFGSYFCISKDTKNGKIYVRELHGGSDTISNIFEINFLNKKPEQKIEFEATETILKLFLTGNKEEYVDIIVAEEDQLHFYVHNIELELYASKDRYDTLHQFDEDKYEYHIYPKEIKLMIVTLDGELKVDAPWNIVGNDYIRLNMNKGEFLIESYRVVYEQKIYSSFENSKLKIQNIYDEWLNNFLIDSDIYKVPNEKAAYILWSSFVHPDGILNDYAMYMSKLWMHNIWSWDNCFNALNLSEKYPDLAFAQLKIFIDNQDKSGVYPDLINDKIKSFNCLKPPIFTYIYEKMMKKNAYFMEKDKLQFIYDSTKKVLLYFDNYRTIEGRLPYYKHGNDSGWDNASLFHEGMIVESPDLASFLIRTYDIMASFAEILMLDDEKSKFESRANDLFLLLKDRLFDEDGFYGRWGIGGVEISNRTSLILRLPLLIGYRLEKQIVEQIVTDLEENFETTFGFATEMPKSVLYKEDGYWLGPIWAPVTYLFYDALLENGFTITANRVRDKFLEVTKTGGMAENFDPFSGQGLVDTSFTWTSSVFLELLKDKIKNK